MVLTSMSDVTNLVWLFKNIKPFKDQIQYFQAANYCIITVFYPKVLDLTLLSAEFQSQKSQHEIYLNTMAQYLKCLVERFA